MSERDSKTLLVHGRTAWPLIAALGLTLIFAGLVTHAGVSIVGAIILLRSSVGWWLDVLPEQKEEAVLMSPADQISTSSLTVDHLTAGHRAQIPLEVPPYWTGLYGGLAGAVAMAVFSTLFCLLSH